MAARAKHHVPVVVLGAGAAGLSAAATLAEGGRRALVLEARGRIGGRIWTIHVPGFSLPLEMGAEFIHGEPDSTLDVVRDAGAVAYQVPFEHLFLRGGKLVKIEAYSEQLARAMGGLRRLRGADKSFADYLRGHRGSGSGAGRKYARDFTEGFDAADLERISARSLAEEQEGLGDVQEDPQHRLLNGYGALMERLHAKVRQGGASIRFGRLVSEIAWGRHHVEVACHNTGEHFLCERCIVALPLGVLQVPPESPGSVRFVPDIAEKRRPLSLLAAGSVVKALVVLRADFWESLPDTVRHGSFMHGMDLPFPTWWTASPLRLPLLTGWVGGPKAAALSGTGVKALREKAVESLRHLLGRTTTKVWAGIRAIQVCDWPADPLARGAYSYVIVGGMQARAAISEPLRGTLFFAGEAFDTSGEASTVAGAIHSGRVAAERILNTR